MADKIGTGQSGRSPAHGQSTGLRDKPQPKTKGPFYRSEKRQKRVDAHYDEVGQMMVDGIANRQAIQDYRQQGSEERDRATRTQRSVSGDAEKRINARTRKSVSGRSGGSGGNGRTSASRDARGRLSGTKRGVVTVEDI